MSGFVCGTCHPVQEFSDSIQEHRPGIGAARKSAISAGLPNLLAATSTTASFFRLDQFMLRTSTGGSLRVCASGLRVLFDLQKKGGDK
jgi:hypothetical protein